MTAKRYAILVGGPGDGSRISVDHFPERLHYAVAAPLDEKPIRGDEPIDWRREVQLHVPVAVYHAVSGAVRPREIAFWHCLAWGPDHEVCMYVYIGERK